MTYVLVIFQICNFWPPKSCSCSSSQIFLDASQWYSLLLLFCVFYEKICLSVSNFTSNKDTVVIILVMTFCDTLKPFKYFIFSHDCIVYVVIKTKRTLLNIELRLCLCALTLQWSFITRNSNKGFSRFVVSELTAPSRLQDETKDSQQQQRQ